MNTLAIDIGGTKFTLAVFEGDRLACRESAATDAAGGKDWMVSRILDIARRWRREWTLDRCGVSFGGPVDYAAQKVNLSTHVDGWSGFDLVGALRDALELPAIIDNDANVAALGEWRHGAGQGCDPLFYMTLSTGIGGGIILGGKVYRGADSWAGEIGHLNVRPDGPACLCGSNGCLERMCSGLWLQRDHGRAVPELLSDAAFVSRYVVDLARGLKACIMLLNPQRIVIGGGISKVGAALLGPLQAELRRQITPWSGARIDVVASTMPDENVLYGALELAKGL